jgi:hypothetical protein
VDVTGVACPIQVTQTGVEIAEHEIPRMAEEFVRTGIVMLRGFLPPVILDPLLKNLETASYEVRHEESGGRGRFGTTLKIPPTDPIISSFLFVLNRESLFEAVRKITGCEPLGNFVGRIHRTGPEGDQHIDWHNDVYDFRTVGLNINLSRQAFTGGSFLLRDQQKVLRREVAEWSPGDAFLFQIDTGWFHRLTPVTAGERTVGVGWFRTRPNWTSIALKSFRAGVVNLWTDDASPLAEIRKAKETPA